MNQSINQETVLIYKTETELAHYHDKYIYADGSVLLTISMF